jgi:carbamoyltransferase
LKILGISAHYHDSAAALVVDGLPVAAVQEERLTRKKHDAGFPLAAIEWCLDTAGLEPDALDAVVFYEKPMLKLERILVTALRAFPRSWKSFPRALMKSFGGKVWVKGLIASHLRVPGNKIYFTEHHQAHAAYAYFTAPTRRAAIVTADGVGEWATFTVGRGEGARVELLRELRWPHSLGMLYSTFTAFLGFTVNEDEYKVMGLAAYGRPRFQAEVRALVRRADDGGFALDLDAFDYHAGAARAWSPRFEEIFGRPRGPFEALDLDSDDGRRWADLAASVQLVLEDEMVEQCRRVRAETGLPDLCLGGGVALNVRANARILAESGFERVFVPPAPGDAGCAVGAALLVDRQHFAQPDRPLPDHPFWGPSVDGADLAAVAREDGLPVEEADDLIPRVAAALAAGKVVGWMDGAAELGPRALGNRSILAAPHDPAMRDRVNQKIKFREEFRPFAPVVPVEVADRWFELPAGGARLGRFMSGVFKVRAPDRLGAVTHVDGSARVQIVDADMAPRLHALLLEYGRLTGVPVLLNTSFNLAGEPIVTTAREGYSSFRRSGLDVLAAPGVLVHKARAEEQAAPLEAIP